MAKKIAKATLSFVMILYFVFLSLFALGDYIYPDISSLHTGETLSGKFCFSYEEDALPACAKAETGVFSRSGKIVAFGMVPIKSVRVNYYEKTKVECGGELFGIRLNTRGLLVTSVENVETEKGTVSPGKDAGIKKGDILLESDGIRLDSAASFSKLIAKGGGKPMEILLLRENEEMCISLTPALSADKSGYRAGLWVRDGAAGIGTVTFRDPETGAFAGLGHAVCDGETGVPFPLAKGSVCRAGVESITKGEGGNPGEICGKLGKETTGSLEANLPTGIYGTLNEGNSEKDLVPIGLKNTVKTGKATLICTLDDSGKQEYEIRIEEIIDKDRETKNFILQVTDPRLLEKTGGIVQGMSGSPIVQDGKLIGAVTHVLVGDPTRGYGIFIENMLGSMPE